MLAVFAGVPKVFKVKARYSKANVDNGAFKLHYRVTTVLLLVATLIVCSQQYIGEKINCLQSKDAVAQNVLDTYCFFIGTYSVQSNTSGYPHHGIGPVDNTPVLKHIYYQWVPFFLFFLSAMFYSPHWIWKLYEGGSLDQFLMGLNMMTYSVTDNSVEVADGNIPSTKQREERLNELARFLWLRMKNKINFSWSSFMVICEIYALAHVLFEYWLTDFFLGGGGSFVNLSSETAPKVFPTTAKCIFYKYGPSGSLQVHDALCVLALNIVNEKIFYMLHLWIPILIVVSGLAILWRLLSLCLHRNFRFNRWVLRKNNPMHLDEDDEELVYSTASYWDWIFLCYLAGNMDGFVFQDLFSALADCIRNDEDSDGVGGDGENAPILLTETKKIH